MFENVVLKILFFKNVTLNIFILKLIDVKPIALKQDSGSIATSAVINLRLDYIQPFSL
jgi:hypothetical protein